MAPTEIVSTTLAHHFVVIAAFPGNPRGLNSVEFNVLVTRRYNQSWRHGVYHFKSVSRAAAAVPARRGHRGHGGDLAVWDIPGLHHHDSSAFESLKTPRLSAGGGDSKKHDGTFRATCDGGGPRL